MIWTCDEGDAQMFHCEGMRSWLRMDSKEIDVYGISIKERWLDKKWHNYNLSKI